MQSIVGHKKKIQSIVGHKEMFSLCESYKISAIGNTIIYAQLQICTDHSEEKTN